MDSQLTTLTENAPLLRRREASGLNLRVEFETTLDAVDEAPKVPFPKSPRLTTAHINTRNRKGLTIRVPPKDRLYSSDARNEETSESTTSNEGELPLLMQPLPCRGTSPVATHRLGNPPLPEKSKADRAPRDDAEAEAAQGSANSQSSWGRALLSGQVRQQAEIEHFGRVLRKTVLAMAILTVSVAVVFAMATVNLYR